MQRYFLSLEIDKAKTCTDDECIQEEEQTKAPVLFLFMLLLQVLQKKIQMSDPFYLLKEFYFFLFISQALKRD